MSRTGLLVLGLVVTFAVAGLALRWHNHRASADGGFAAAGHTRTTVATHKSGNSSASDSLAARRIPTAAGQARGGSAAPLAAVAPPATMAEAMARLEQDRKGVRAGAPTAQAPGEPATGSVSAGGHRHELPAIAAGSFGTVFLKDAQPVDIAVQYPNANPGDPVQVEILDGGSFADIKEIGRLERLDACRSLSVRYVPTGERRTARLSLRKGGQVNIVDLWIGEPPEMRGDTATAKE